MLGWKLKQATIFGVFNWGVFTIMTVITPSNKKAKIYIEVGTRIITSNKILSCRIISQNFPEQNLDYYNNYFYYDYYTKVWLSYQMNSYITE